MLAASLTLTGCFTAPGSADVYSVGRRSGEQTVRMGTVESVRAVRIQSDGGGSAIGTLGGGALGAVAGAARSAAAGVDPDRDRRRPRRRGRGQRGRRKPQHGERCRNHRAPRQRRSALDHAGCKRRSVPRRRTRATAVERRRHARHALTGTSARGASLVERMCEAAHAFFVRTRRSRRTGGRYTVCGHIGKDGRKIPPPEPDGGTD